MSNRIGKFCVDEKLIRDHWEVIAPLMKNFVVVQATMRFDIRAIEYIALSPFFDDLGDGPFYPPEYEVEFVVKPGIEAYVKVNCTTPKTFNQTKVTRKLVI